MSQARLGDGCRRGLTLVEVLVVIGIIALLGGIIIPVVSRARGNAKLVQCVANLRQIDLAFKGSDINRPDTRLPSAGEWIFAVFNAGPDAYKVLTCPDGGEGETYAEGSAARFHAWSGSGSGNPNGSRLNGGTAWREIRTPETGSPYTLTYIMQPNRPEPRVSRDESLGGDKWRATVLEVPAGYRIDCLVLSDGRRFSFVKGSFTVDYQSRDGGVDYGFNLMGSRLGYAKAGKIVAMDYVKSVFDLDGLRSDGLPVPPNANDDDYLPTYLPTRRHVKKVNALLSDGSVQAFRPDELAPSNDIYAIGPRRGPNPGGAAPVSTRGNGGTNGGGNGGGNGGNGGGNGGNGGTNGGGKGGGKK